MKTLISLVMFALIQSTMSFAGVQTSSEIQVEVQYCSSQSGFGAQHLCALVYGQANGQEMPIDTNGDTGLMTSLTKHISVVSGRSFAFVVFGHVEGRIQQPGRHVNVLVVERIVSNPHGPRPR